MRIVALGVWLAACGGTPDPAVREPSEQTAAEQDAVEAEVADEVVAARHDEGATPTHAALLQQLETSTARMADLGGECSLLGDDTPLLGDAVRAALADADTQSSTCEARADRGFACETTLMNSTGGDESEFAIFLRYQVDAAGHIDVSTLECLLAG